MLSVSFSATVPPSGYFDAPSVSTSLPCCSASLATLRTKSWNSSFLATKSVSEFTSTTAPRLPSTATPTRPSAAVRPAFFAAAASPLARSQSIAGSISPLVSASAFLQSIIPAPVRSRSSLTLAAVISAMSLFLYSPLPLGGGAGRGGLQEVGTTVPPLTPLPRAGGEMIRLPAPARRAARPFRRCPRLRPPPAGAALAHLLGDRVRVQADRAAGVVVAGDRERNPAPIRVRIEDRDDR